MQTIENSKVAKNTGSYSSARKTGDYIYVSGQGPIDPQGNIVSGSVKEETSLTMKNIKGLIEAARASMSKVVKCNCYLADINDFDEFDVAYREAFPGILPARTTVGAKLLGIKVEIDAVAYIGKDS